jgi:hypothetical protein
MGLISGTCALFLCHYDSVPHHIAWILRFYLEKYLRAEKSYGENERVDDVLACKIKACSYHKNNPYQMLISSFITISLKGTELNYFRQ